MKKILLSLTVLLFTCTISFSQSRIVARGAEPGELYLATGWYGIYNPIWGPMLCDTLKKAVYRLTENGKKLTKQYDVDWPSDPENIMLPSDILADATSGVVYNTINYSKNSYEYTQLWVSYEGCYFFR